MAIVSIPSSRSWADFTDEAVTDPDATPQASAEAKLSVPNDKLAADLDPFNDNQLEVGMQGRVHMAQQPICDEPSVGSIHHRMGRCKPCAFFHTKGCQNDKACLFCHLCPPGEKQRRKRLREQMCAKLGQCMQRGLDPVDRRFFKPGHVRQPSGGTSTCASSSQSTCSGWTKFSHSRQSSGSSVALSVQDAGVVQMAPQCMPQMMPVFHFPQHMMQPMALGAESNAPQSSPENAMEKNEEGNADETSSSSKAMTIALAQAVPHPEQGNSNGWTANNLAGQMPHLTTAAYYNGSGVVQYALVPVPVPLPMQQQHNMDPPVSYACFPPQPQLQAQAPVSPAGNMQYLVQDCQG